MESVFFYLDVGMGEDPCDNHRKKGYTIVDWCCRCTGEGVNLLLIHCKVAYHLWCFVLRSFGISWVLLGSVKDVLFGWRNWFGKYSLDIWNLVPLCLMWTLWQEWNGRTFEDLDNSSVQLLALFVGTLFDWSRLSSLGTHE